MKIPFKSINIIIIFLMALVISYQCKNPKIVQLPAEPVKIDPDTWVARSEYNRQRTILNRLEDENEVLAGQVRRVKDEIAGYTKINARLKLEIDSLTAAPPKVIKVPVPTEISPQKQTYTRTVTYNDSLFAVTGMVEFQNDSFSQDVTLKQLRDVRFNVVTTVSKNKDRVMTYVNSPDFAEIDFQGLTAIKPKKKLPWFLIGVGAGAVVTYFISPK